MKAASNSENRPPRLQAPPRTVKRTPLIAVRHTPVPGGQGLCYGRSDLPVNARDVADAARRLRGVLPEWALVSSPSQRTRQLAEATSRAFRIAAGGTRGVPASYSPVRRPIRFDPRLADMDYGQWEGRPWCLIPREHLDVWAADQVGFTVPEGERYADLEARVAAALAELLEPTIWFTHAGVIRALHHLRGGLAHAEALATDVPYATPLRF